MDPVLILDDGGAGLAPINDLRATFDVRTGAVTTLERLARQSRSRGLGPIAGLIVRPELSALRREAGDGLAVNDLGAALGDADRAIVVAGSCVMLPEGAESLERDAVLADEAGAMAAARVPRDVVEALVAGANVEWGAMAVRTCEVMRLRRPWDVIRHRNACIASDLEAMLSARFDPADVLGELIEPERISVASGALVARSAVLDASAGPIVIEAGARVGHGVVVEGPVFVGRGSTLVAHAHIRPNGAIGPMCKVGGEVSGSIVQGYSNKAHGGYVGDSYVGEWVNLGAGTMTSNLLNTYGEVKSASPPREPTGLSNLGSILGDHSKAAIGTRLMTGTVFGTATMCVLSGLPPTSTRAFTWLTDRAPDGTEAWGFDKFMETARAMMARRGVELSEAARTLLYQIAEARA